MSNNKTIIPGLEGTSIPTSNSLPENNVYMPYEGKTVIPGINNGNVASTKVLNSKPVVGFLYSISRTGNGEYWPLRVGPNSIGRSKGCDIYLPEATVSEQHAEFVVRLMKNPEKVIASIYDHRSTCGTMINGESLGFEPRECMNGDIITIGDHYDLYVILIDVKQLGLSTCQAFIPSDTYSEGGHQVQDTQGSTRVYDSHFAEVPAQAPAEQMTPPPFRPGRTVGVDTNGNPMGPRNTPGKTQFM